MITFTVKDKPGTYRFANRERGFTFGSLLNEAGVAGRGRPSKFANDLVTLSEPLPEVVKPENVITVPEPVEAEKQLPLPEPNRENGDFIPLE